MRFRWSIGAALAAAAVVAFSVQAADDGWEAKREALKNKPRQLILNSDGNEVIYWKTNLPVTVGNFTTQRLKTYRGSKVSTVSYCPQSSGFGYMTTTRAGEFFDIPRCIPELRPDCLNAAPLLKAKGLDCLDLTADYCHTNGMEVFVSIRVNDTHDHAYFIPGTKPPRSYLFPKWKDANPDCLFGSRTNRPPFCSWTAVDFENPKTRDYMKRFVSDFVNNYDVDGIEYDFFRHGQVFKSVGWGAYATEAQLNLMTDFMLELRAITEAAGRKKGTPILVLVRTADSLGYAKAQGLDVEAWLRRGVMDIWSVSDYFQLGYLKPNAELAHKYGVKFYSALAESRVPGAFKREKKNNKRLAKAIMLPGRNTIESYAAEYSAAMAAGCDGISSFNLSCTGGINKRGLIDVDPRRTKDLDKVYFALVRGSGGYRPERWVKDGGRFYVRPRIDPATIFKIPAGKPYVFGIEFGDEDWARFDAVAKAAFAGGEKVITELKVNDKAIAPGVFADGVQAFPLQSGDLKKGYNEFSVTVDPKFGKELIFHDFAVYLNKKKVLPKVWMSCGGLPVTNATELASALDDLKSHGVDVFEAKEQWVDRDRALVLRTCREKGLKLFTAVSDASRSFAQARNAELAVMIGGAYQGKAIDRHLYSFSAEKHSIVVEPPVYSVRQCYLKFPHYMMMGDGHYYGLYVPTGRAEIIVPEKLYDGTQHLRIIPATVRRAPKGAVPENDTAVKCEKTKWIENRYLVQLDFDLTGCESCLLDKVGIAVYWHMDVSSPAFKPQRGCYSVFSGRVRGKQAQTAKDVIAAWKKADGGKFPSDVVIAARIGDEVFNHTGMLDQNGVVSLPIWGFSESGRTAIEKAMKPGETYPRTFGFPEIYGPEAAARYLETYHRACAETVKCAVDVFHTVGVKCFRNTTRGGPWSYGNDHDGTGQEMLAQVFDYLHLDPYPVRGAHYDEWKIPTDLQYMKGLSRRYGKPIINWMQAHSFGSGGLTHPSPEQVRRMYGQVKAVNPEAIMWLGYNWNRKKASSTFPWQRPDSWEEARACHADFHALSPDSLKRADVAVVRGYLDRANVRFVRGEKNGDRNLQDEVAELVRKGVPFDVFEVPCRLSEGKRKELAAELSRYRKVIGAASGICR